MNNSAYRPFNKYRLPYHPDYLDSLKEQESIEDFTCEPQT